MKLICGITFSAPHGEKTVVLMLIIFLTISLLWSVSRAMGEPQESSISDAGHIEEGDRYFKKGYYELLPKNEKSRASQEFERAVRAYKKAIDLNRDNVEAHRRLGRVYYVQKRYLEAAKQYRKVTDLNPSDVDSYVMAALAYTRIQRYAEAITQLKVAKTFTQDKEVIERLDGYIERIQEEEFPK